MKKLEASLIKRILRISWYLLSVQFWSYLFIISLSYSWTLIFFLEHSWRVWHNWILGSRRKRKSMKVQEGINISNYIRFSCKYRVECMISSLVLACMAYACGLLVMIYHWHGGISYIDRIFLALPFPG